MLMTTDNDLLKLNCFAEDAPELMSAYTYDAYACMTNLHTDVDGSDSIQQSASIDHAGHGHCSGTADTTTWYAYDCDVRYYGYRYYSPSLGRWLSSDPIGEQGGINLFGFLGNNPVDYFDELGLACSWSVGLCTRPLQALNVPPTVTINGTTYNIPKRIRNLVGAMAPDHHNVKVESYKMPNCVIGSVIEESIVRGFFADSFSDGITHYAVSLIPLSGVAGWVSGHVACDSNPGTCSRQCVSKERFDLVKQRIIPDSHPDYHLTKFNCQNWAAQQLQ